MKVGALSDSHVSVLSSRIVEKLRNLNLDLIIHCGDYTGIAVVQQLQALGNFSGVAGNMDPLEIRHILKEREVIEVEGKRIGIIHGYGLFFGDRKLEAKFKGEKIDIFIHGHTHKLRKEKEGDVYYLNPGAFPGSMLILNIKKERELTVEILRT